MVKQLQTFPSPYKWSIFQLAVISIVVVMRISCCVFHKLLTLYADKPMVEINVLHIIT